MLVALLYTQHCYPLEAALTGYQKALAALQNAFIAPPKKTAPPITTPQKTGQFHYKTVEQWIDACDELPSWHKSQEGTLTAKDFTAQELMNGIDACEKTMSTYLLDKKQWVGTKSLDKPYLQNPNRPFQPYTQKLVLPPQTTLLMHGDLHGDMRSVRYFLKELLQQGIIRSDFTIIKPDHYILFLGDYTDRGLYGAEVLYSILRLKAANPTQCVLVRGNHEDLYINIHYGFMQEVKEKFGELAPDLFSHICNWYELLPAVLFVGSQKNPNEFIQCCHGGIEIGYNPAQLFSLKTDLIGFELIETLEQGKGWEKMLKAISHDPDAIVQLKQQYTDSQQVSSDALFTNKKPLSPREMGFMWNDFIVDPAKSIAYVENRGWTFGALSTSAWRFSLPGSYTVVGIFRAHQHGDNAMMDLMTDTQLTPGTVQLWRHKSTPAVGTEKPWNGMVVTLNVCPDTPYGHSLDPFDFDTYARLTVGTIFEKDWKLEILNKKIYVSYKSDWSEEYDPEASAAVYKKSYKQVN